MERKKIIEYFENKPISFVEAAYGKENGLVFYARLEKIEFIPCDDDSWLIRGLVVPIPQRLKERHTKYFVFPINLRTMDVEGLLGFYMDIVGEIDRSYRNRNKPKKRYGFFGPIQEWFSGVWLRYFKRRAV